MLIEPTETESIETLDAFADALIAHRARGRDADPETVKSAPHTAPVRRLDETGAARNPNLRWRPAVGDWTPCPGLTCASVSLYSSGFDMGVLSSATSRVGGRPIHRRNRLGEAPPR